MSTGLPTLIEVIAEVQALDPAMTPDHRLFKTAVFMMAAAQGIGQSDLALHRFTGFSRGFLIRRIKNLRAAGLWIQGQCHHRWYEQGTGPIDFRLDVKIAEGELDEDGGRSGASPAEG